MAKTIGVKKLDEGEFYGIQFIKPNQKSKGFTAKSQDYTVIMHFNDIIKQKIVANGITEDGIDQAFQDYQLENFKRKNLHIQSGDMNLNSLKAQNTIGAKHTGKMDLFGFKDNGNKKKINQSKLKGTNSSNSVALRGHSNKSQIVGMMMDSSTKKNNALPSHAESLKKVVEEEEFNNIDNTS